MKGWIFKEQLWIPAWKYPVSKIIDGATFHWIKYWLITKPKKYVSFTNSKNRWSRLNYSKLKRLFQCNNHKLHQFSRQWKEAHSSFSVMSFYILKNENVWTTIYEWHETLNFNTKNWLSSLTMPPIVSFVQ